MANTITLTSTLSYKDSTGTQALGGSFSVTQVGSNVTEETQTATTSAALIDLGAAIVAGTLGFLIVKNLDATNYIEVASDSGMTNNITRILAGQTVPIVPKAGLTPYVKSNAAPVQFKFMAIEL